MATPRARVEFSPDPAGVMRAWRRVGQQLGGMFKADLIRAGFHDDIAETIRARVRQRGQDRTGRQMPRYAPLTIRRRRAMGLQTSHRDLTESGQMLDAMTGLVRGGEMAVGFMGGRSGRGPRTNELLARFHISGTRPPRRRGTGFRDQRRRTGSRSKGDAGGIPPADWFGLTRGEEAMAGQAALLIFGHVTFPRITGMLGSAG